ncbi:MAG: 16S rRNA (cytidine(1402)-2'-O)-methyltransferase [Candidatus Krumholzibacteria bacterium]|nr:16S rRNA (cytidine(1402)-2'-O)-methyltransferase [Candidatus Krumholzibacteria bacterium]MDH4337709.1 16S rRNA (cytidine(1402)-2'-O)-methyltransferase [Candidatus Krumholzibacteria bacterium]MDH5269852.1 16S rRNA (cytidine(1402)-2'-O)-methyltransferase [Candidatus Krumholzibacteria bacterium]
MSQPGTLTLVATPIGNLGDITLRAIEVLKGVDVVLAEDTRHTGRLLKHLDITTPLESYHDHNEARITPALVERMLGGASMALVTDAGTPGISDPGFYLVRAALAAGIAVTMAPGANAVLPALVLSGFPCESFVFVGFTPRKPGELARTIEALAEEPRTTVFYVSPHQFRKVLEKIAARFPEREIAVARELTKLHEEVVRGSAQEVRDRLGPRKEQGEFVLVVKGVGWRKRGRKHPDEDAPEAPAAPDA